MTTRPVYQNGTHEFHYANEMRLTLRLVAAQHESGMNYYESVSFSGGNEYYMLGLYDDDNCMNLIVSPTSRELIYHERGQNDRFYVQTREHTYDLSVPFMDDDNAKIIEHAHAIFQEIEKMLPKVMSVYRKKPKKSLDELFDELFPMMETADAL